MPKTPGKMHMYDMAKIDTIVFEIVGGGGAFKLSDSIKGLLCNYTSQSKHLINLLLKPF